MKSNFWVSSMRFWERQKKKSLLLLKSWKIKCTSQMNNAHKKGLSEGLTQGRLEVIELLKSGKTPEEIIRDYGNFK
jgi:hypothetical protein